MNRLTTLFNKKKANILNLYFTLGHPTLEAIGPIIRTLEASGVDMIEIGMPYSDPLADGETIQNSGQIALKNGMNLNIMFEEIKKIRQNNDIPIIAMGYYNQVLQYGVERFLASCADAGIDGLIIPDLPMDVYEKDYKSLFDKYDIKISFLITPQTTNDRIRKADALSNSFLYVVSQSSITGKKGNHQAEQIAYFNGINEMNLRNPRLIGFGIHDKATYDSACQYATGAIIGSQFIRVLEAGKEDVEGAIRVFVEGVR